MIVIFIYKTRKAVNSLSHKDYRALIEKLKCEKKLYNFLLFLNCL